MGIFISIGSLIISFLALTLSFVAERRSKSFRDLDFHAATLDSALGIEMTLNTLYSNVLTLDLTGYRSEVRDIVIKARSDLPKIIADVARSRERIQSLHDSKELKKVAGELRSLHTQARILAESMLHGFERGKTA